MLWLVAQWIPVDFDSDNSRGHRAALYRATAAVLESEEDVVVRAMATVALEAAVDNFGFRADALLPHVATLVRGLFRLLCDAKQCQLKMAVLRRFDKLVAAAGRSIQASVAPLVRRWRRPSCRRLSPPDAQATYLPRLWAAAARIADAQMLQMQIVRTLSSLVRVLGPRFAPLAPFLATVIRFSVDLAQPAHVFLLEDGLELWCAVLEHSETANEMLVALLPLLGPVLARGAALIRSACAHQTRPPTPLTADRRPCCCIITPYVLLAGKGFLQAHGAAIAAAITPLMSDPLPEGLKALCAMCDTVMVAFGAAGCRLLQAPLAAALGDVLEQGHGDQQGFGHRLGLLLRCAAAAQRRRRSGG